MFMTCECKNEILINHSKKLIIILIYSMVWSKHSLILILDVCADYLLLYVLLVCTIISQEEKNINYIKAIDTIEY